MARTPIRTVSVARDIVERVLNLFGTVMNAHRQLGLGGTVPYQHFYRAMHHYTIIPQHKQAIEDAWDRWRYVYLRPEVPLSSTLDLDEEVMLVNPEWLPEPVTPAVSRKRSTR